MRMETRISRLRARVGRRDEMFYLGVGYPWDSGFSFSDFGTNQQQIDPYVGRSES